MRSRAGSLPDPVHLLQVHYRLTFLSTPSKVNRCSPLPSAFALWPFQLLAESLFHKCLL